MSSKSITLIIKPRGNPIRNLPDETAILLSDSGAELHKQIAKASQTSIHRLRITKGSDNSVVANSKDVSIESTGLRDRSSIVIKDLGPQISWQTVFIIEYIGPILIHPLLYFLRPYVYGTNLPPSTLQTISCILVTLHFVKRELETLFIHRFSLATMPFRNVFKNSAHYWLVSGLLMAWFTYAPNGPTQKSQEDVFGGLALTQIGLFLYTIGELGNLSNHLTLRNLRSSGSTERGIPQGLGFNLVTCPNYMFETISWLGMFCVNRSWSTVVFIVLAVAQMAAWAKKKERRYRKEFGSKYEKKKYGMIPGLF
ncbi:3-oxo-5-alpha-steroid 4-dehydrogenase family protein-like protein [Patellaria atrata CBS 101060]|uniref:very-long-chain enoyl-CoA reductase n=1 Tax=Patellaria atrata CBS 101060 TaxID=1346257 RepID=A0A9P4VS51_9PEZI|nr:3-oxo-5-alpha-steroid 4-dehydrogenase family protein-like protein [Patellaria atrata CBS 101060]